MNSCAPRNPKEAPIAYFPPDQDGDELAEMGHAERAEWDARYHASERVWSGNPNFALVHEVAAIAPGRALDVGCGEGTDAIWLALLGWTVMALDVSEVALQHAALAAKAAEVQVEWLHAALLDAPLAIEGFDLVSVFYPALRRTPGHDAERSIVGAVSRGGHLLVVHHSDFDHDEATAHGFDPANYVRPGDVTALLGEGWTVQYDERRPRQISSGAGARHTHDTVLHAVRTT